MEQCSSCRFSHEVTENRQTFLVCRRYPPQVILVPVQSFTGDQNLAIKPVFPPVQPIDICGEFSEFKKKE